MYVFCSKGWKKFKEGCSDISTKLELWRKPLRTIEGDNHDTIILYTHPTTLSKQSRFIGHMMHSTFY